MNVDTRASAKRNFPSRIRSPSKKPSLTPGSPAAPPRDALTCNALKSLEVPLILHVLDSRAEVIRFPQVFGAPALRPPAPLAELLVQRSCRARLDRFAQLWSVTRSRQHNMNVIALYGHRVQGPIISRTKI